MENKLVCERCGADNPENFCTACKNPPENNRYGFESMWIDLLYSLTHIHIARFYRTFIQIVFHPGDTLLRALKMVKDVFPAPFQYLFVNAGLYKLSIDYVLKPQGWYYGVTGDIKFYQLFVILMGLSLIGYLVIGKRGEKYTYWEVLVIFSYIYGTVFLLNPVLIVLERPLLDHLSSFQLETKWLILITDIVPTLFILTWCWDFFIKAGLGRKKFLITAVLGFAYYIIIMRILL